MTLELLTPATTATNGNGIKPVATREVVLFGYAEETRDLVHTLNENVEVWGINMAHAFLERKAHYWFQLHPRSWATGGKSATGYYGRPKEHLDFLQAFEGTVWLTEPAPDIPNGKSYPLAEVIALFGREYLTSTFAYQLALALYEHVHGQPISTIHMFGINLTALEEYAGQRPCAEYWIGRLEQAGVRVDIPVASALCKGSTYPLRGNELQEHAVQRQQHLKEKYMIAWANGNTALAMMTELKHWAKFLSTKEIGEGISPEVRKLIQERFDKRHDTLDQMTNQFSADLNGALGMSNNNQHWL